jgi:hypothetical protein
MHGKLRFSRTPFWRRYRRGRDVVVPGGVSVPGMARFGKRCCLVRIRVVCCTYDRRNRATIQHLPPAMTDQFSLLCPASDFVLPVLAHVQWRNLISMRIQNYDLTS